jgi:Xaa-Pro aminopeptidase
MIAAMLADGGEVPTMLSWISGPWGRLSRRLTIATQRVMQKGDAIVNEVEARYGGYTGQQEQPLFLGPVPQDAQDLLQVQSEALQAALSVIRPGQTFQSVIDAVTRVTERSTKFAARLIMHGRGLGDDWPLIVDGQAAGASGQIQAEVIEANTVFTVKPGAAPKNSSYRGERMNWSDTVLVTETGVQRLGTRAPGILSVDC